MFPQTVAPTTPAVPSEISLTELAERLHSAQPPLVAEILGPQHFAAGHLPFAVNLPLEGFSENAQRAWPNKAASVVVYCASASCQNSDIAARRLQSLGYQDVRIFRGGKAAWKAAGHPLVA